MKSKGDQTVFTSSEENDLLARLVHRLRISRFHEIEFCQEFRSYFWY